MLEGINDLKSADLCFRYLSNRHTKAMKTIKIKRATPKHSWTVELLCGNAAF